MELVLAQNAHSEPPGVWLRRLFLAYASRNAERSLSALSLHAFKQLIRDMQIGSRLGNTAGDELYNATRSDGRMDYGAFAEAMARMACKAYPALAPRDAFDALLERDVLPRVGDRTVPPEPLDEAMAASARTLQALSVPLHSVWLGYCMRPGVTFGPRSRNNRASAVQAVPLLIGSVQPGAPGSPLADVTIEGNGDEGMQLEGFMRFCADGGILTQTSAATLAELYTHALEGSYDPWLSDGEWQPVLTFASFQVALVRVAHYLWKTRAHADVSDRPWPTPLKGLLMLMLLYTRQTELSTNLSRLRSRYRLGIAHEQMVAAGWHALLRQAALVWTQDDHVDYYAPPPVHRPSGLELLGVKSPADSVRGDAGARVDYSPARSSKFSPSTPFVSSPGRTPGAGAFGAFGNSGARRAVDDEDDEEADAGTDGAYADAEGDDESEEAAVAAVRAAVGADVSDALARSQLRAHEPAPMPPKSPMYPKSPLHADDSSLSAGSSVVRATHWPPASSPRRRPGSILVSPRGPGAASASPRRPAAVLVSPRSAQPQAVRRMTSSSPRALAGFAHSPSVASARSLRGGADGEPSSFYTSPRAATYGPMPWDAGESWARDPNWPPSERLKDTTTPRTTAEALTLVGTGSYAKAQHRQAQARARHDARWDFGPIESHLHATPVGVDRRVERRMNDLIGNKLRSPGTPKTPKQWIALDDNIAVRR